MELKLSDNIRKYRKEMGLTQEELAEAFGVTIGAVVWWAFLAFVVNIFRDKIGPRHIMWINKITGVCVMLFGTSVIIMVTFFNDKL